MKRLSTLFMFVSMISLAAACGGSDKPAVQEPVTDPAPHADEEHGKLTPELDAFHDSLAPRWHAEKGAARQTDTCGAIADFQSKAAAVKAAPAPAGADAAAWTTAGTELETSVGALATACSTNDSAAFETSFEQVHHAFHKAMELAAPPAGDAHGPEGMHDHGTPAPNPAPQNPEPTGAP